MDALVNAGGVIIMKVSLHDYQERFLNSASSDAPSSCLRHLIEYASARPSEWESIFRTVHCLRCGDPGLNGSRPPPYRRSKHPVELALTADHTAFLLARVANAEGAVLATKGPLHRDLRDLDKAVRAVIDWAVTLEQARDPRLAFIFKRNNDDAMTAPAGAGDPLRDEELLGWNAKQGHILSGGGKLEQCFVEGRDYRAPHDLPHFLKSRGRAVVWETFGRWLRERRRSDAVVGAWSRPLFTGGWQESGVWDTQVFNLQTPSIFVDIRFPSARRRPVHTDFANAAAAASPRRGGLEDLTLDELRVLSRQHTFAGYTLVEGPSHTHTRAGFTSTASGLYNHDQKVAKLTHYPYYT